jgi:hypothetical protein
LKLPWKLCAIAESDEEGAQIEVEREAEAPVEMETGAEGAIRNEAEEEYLRARLSFR